MKELIRSIDSALLYRRTSEVSVGEQVLRSAAVIEQTFGGLTSNLWDDPFEWTLPETLSTPELIVAHLAEVDALRRRFFSSIEGDAALSKYVAVPSGEPCALVELLRETLLRASDCHKKAQKTQKELLSNAS